MLLNTYCRKWVGMVFYRSSLALTVAIVVMTLAASVSAQTTGYNEAPQLAQRVETGELPPVEERLPANPMVVPVVERIGDYGGTWRTALLGGEDFPWLGRTIGYENLVRLNPEWTEIIPNIAESYEINEDATEYTFRLREGTRWSDGHPFTADDIMFWYEDVIMNPEISPVGPPGWLRAGGEPVVVEKVDDYSVIFRFLEPNAFFLQNLAAGHGGSPIANPRHYLQQFHRNYNPDGIDALVQEAGFSNWNELFVNRANLWYNPELPRLHAWVTTNAYGDGSRLVAERNPYYFKVDSEGNQLPYLDSVIYELLADSEVLLFRVLSGEIDLLSRHITTTTNRPVLFDNMERGNYRLFEVIPSANNTMGLALNLTHRDPIKREIFSNKDFRIGLSHAIDRQEIIDLVYIGQGEPYQSAPRPEAPFYNEQLAKQYTEYDVDLANEYLDRSGYSQRDAQGFRLGPDGNRISFVVELHDVRDWADSLELIQTHWQEVGIDMHVRVIDRSLVQTRMQANEHDAIAWFGRPGLMDAILQFRWEFPSHWESAYAVPWANWYTGDEGPREEPPPVTRQQMEIYDQITRTVDEAEQIRLAEEIIEIAAEQFYVMGISLPAPGYGIVKNNFRNVPESMFNTGNAYFDPGPTNPEQYFIESSAR